MKKIICFLLLCFSMLACMERQEKIQEINETLKLKVGQELRFYGFSEKMKEFSFEKVKGDFYIVYIQEGKKGLFLDEEYGSLGRRVKKKKGHLIVSGDYILAEMCGIEFVPKKNRYKEWRLKNSLLIICDSNGVIKRMYKNASDRDLTRIAKEEFNI